MLDPKRVTSHMTKHVSFKGIGKFLELNRRNIELMAEKTVKMVKMTPHKKLISNEKTIESIFDLLVKILGRK
jgi:hypothetical protein